MNDLFCDSLYSYYLFLVIYSWFFSRGWANACSVPGSHHSLQLFLPIRPSQSDYKHITLLHLNLAWWAVHCWIVCMLCNGRRLKRKKENHETYLHMSIGSTTGVSLRAPVVFSICLLIAVWVTIAISLRIVMYLLLC